jgi:diaminopimelate epimerase
MRTFERGVGETLACGSGACAAAHVWAKRNQLSTKWTVQVDVLGGTLFVDSKEDGALVLRGPAEFVATGQLYGDQWQIS